MAARFTARPDGARIFGTDASGYHAARAGYQPELLDAIVAFAGGALGDVVEIGPGTGMATRGLLARGATRLRAVEPDAGMAAFLRRSIPDHRLEVIEAGFLEAPLAERAHDCIAAACAFHWIEPAAGFARLARLVRPDGCVALWWHCYRNAARDPFFDALRPHLADVPRPPLDGESGGGFRDAGAMLGHLRAAGFREVECREFETWRTLDAAAMVGLYASFSFMRLLEPARREALLATIADLVETRFGGAAPSLLLSPLYLARGVGEG